jgi:hypothetical protein
MGKQRIRFVFRLFGWAVFIFVIAAFLVLPVLAPFGDNRKKVVAKRVQAAGGWIVIQKECESLLTNDSLQHEKGKYWSPSYGALSNRLAILEPREILFDLDTNHPPVVKIKLYGSGKTDWTPYYGIWVVCDEKATNYIPTIFTEAPHPYSIQRLSDSVFEVSQK